MRMLWALAGWLCVGLGAIGIVLPLLPTVPFLLLAAFCFARSSERFHTWLVEHPTFGPPIADWNENGAIGRRAKWLATASMGGVFLISLLWAPILAIAAQAAVLPCVALFIWTRPDGPR